MDEEVEKLSVRVVRAVRELRDINAIIEECPHSVYIKAADGQMLFTNTVYDQLFGKGGVTSTGRYSQAFLDEIILPISKHSDALILSGCTLVKFDHPGRDSNKQSLLLRSVKKSLLGIGHPKIAILGVTQVLEVSDDDSRQKILSLARSWRLFASLDERDRECATMMVRGEKTKAIAEKFGVTDKTVDNRRAVILKTLNLKNPMELTRLLCRLQDNGFCDFGLD